jgi:hypothetical protein
MTVLLSKSMDGVLRWSLQWETGLLLFYLEIQFHVNPVNEQFLLVLVCREITI